jgi:hypothetical protein
MTKRRIALLLIILLLLVLIIGTAAAQIAVDCWGPNGLQACPAPVDWAYLAIIGG